MKKLPFVDLKLLKKIRQSNKTDSAIKTWSRNSTIIPEMVGCVLRVHNGRHFIPVHIQEEMVGQKLREFAPTRQQRQRDKKK